MGLLEIGASLIGGLLGAGSSSSGGSERQTVVNEPWAGVQPYLVGSSPGLGWTPPERPINNDWLAWQYYASQGLPVGPPPPMFVDDPRYTGQNVYDAPFTYVEPKQNIGYGDPYARYGAPPGGMPSGSGQNAPPSEPVQYPSQTQPQNTHTPAAPQEPAQAAPAGSTRWSPLLGRMVTVDDRGNPIEDVDQEAAAALRRAGVGAGVRALGGGAYYASLGASGGRFDLWTDPARTAGSVYGQGNMG